MTFAPNGAREETVRKYIALIVVFVFLAGVAPAQAQVGLLGGRWPSSWEGWLYSTQGNQVMVLQESNIRLVEQLMGSGRRASLRRVTDDLIGYGPYVGLNGPRGFYPMYQCSSKGRRWERGIGTTLITTAIGAAVAGKKGAAIGAGVGAGYALYKDASCQPVQNSQVQIIGLEGGDQTMVVQPQMPQQASSGRPRNGWDDVLRRQQGALAGPAANPGSGEFTLVNATRFPVDVYDGTCEEGCYKGRMGPDEERQVPAPNIGYKGYALIPNSRGGLSKDRTDLHPSDDGWVFIEPSFGSGR